MFAAGAAVMLIATVIIAYLPTKIDPVTFEMPITVIGFILLPIMSAVSLLATAVARRWSPAHSVTIASWVTAVSIAVWLSLIVRLC